MSLLKNVCFFKLDITNYKALEEVFKDNEIEVVFHQAAIASVSESFEDPIYTHAVNVDTTLQLFYLAHKYQKELFILLQQLFMETQLYYY
ncbi:MAG: NAD-dependent epimerase/dehydratase family protein [Promethearchaeota archaeon]